MPPQCLCRQSATNDEFDRLARIARHREISYSTRKHAVRFRARLINIQIPKMSGRSSRCLCDSLVRLVTLLAVVSLHVLLRFRPFTHSPIRRFTHSLALLLRRLEFSEFFLGVDHVGFVRAAKLQQSLLATQVCFGGFELGGLAFGNCCLRCND
jgi:hypothetical protein